jgi:hypothetical protein
MALNYTLNQAMEALESAPLEGRMLQTRDPLDPAPLLQGFAHYEPAITEMEDEARAVTVADDATSAQCAEMAGQTRKLFNEIEKARKAALEPYNSVVKMVNGSVKDFTDRLTMLQKLLEGKNRAYMIEQDRIRREAEAKARAEAERLRREAEAKARAEAEAKAKAMQVPVEDIPVEPVFVQSTYIPPAETKITTESGSQRIEYEMVPEVMDFRALPDECLQARHKEILAAVMPWINARKKAGIFNDPGITWTKQPIMKTRAGR